VVLLLVLLVCSTLAQNITVQIYSGQSGELQNSFQNWSWGKVNLQDKTLVRPGSSYSASLDVKNYEAAYFHGDFYVSAPNLPQLSFWINGGPKGGQAISLHVTSGANAVGQPVVLSTLLGKPLPADQWVQVVTTFSVFQAPNVLLDGLQFQADSGDEQGNIYLDDIQFIFTLPAPEPVTVKSTKDVRQSVSPLIYGVNFASADQIKQMKYTVNRWGGNAVTRYNYLVDAGNHAADWYFEDIANDVTDVSKLPDGSQNYMFVKDTLGSGAKVLLTTPTIGWRPFDRQRRCGFSVAKYGAQQQTDPYAADCGNGKKTRWN